MATSDVQESNYRVQQIEKRSQFPAGTVRFDFILALLSLWMLGGLYLDGSAHHHIPELIETFFTPWHAVLYSGFLVNAGVLLITQYSNVSKGYSWASALPQGYMASLFGSVIFLFSGFGDMLWHETFGFEVGLEALVSPTHLTLAVGGFLMISGPLRATLKRTNGQMVRGWRELLPAILSLLGILSLLTFFTGDFAIITYPHLMIEAPTADSTFLNDMHALASVLIPSAILMAVILFALRQWTLPTGSLSFLIIGNGLLMTGFHLQEVTMYPQVLLVLVLTGLVADALYSLFKSSTTQIKSLRLFAFTVPAVMFALFFIILLMTTGIWWSVHMWTGAVFLAGATGLLVSYLVYPADDNLSSEF